MPDLIKIAANYADQFSTGFSLSLSSLLQLEVCAWKISVIKKYKVVCCYRVKIKII